jgi:hypothetical protein
MPVVVVVRQTGLVEPAVAATLREQLGETVRQTVVAEALAVTAPTTVATAVRVG